jgi:dolichol-phosphate mannosyltransferase
MEKDSRASVTIVAPTYKEAENIQALTERVARMRESSGLDAELIIVDDDSRDGTEEIFQRLNLPWARLIVRKEDRGLSQAVLEGFCSAKNDMLVVMDADLSHPPETIPAMVEALENGGDFVIGSRYVPGGSTDEEWGVFRQLNSRVATILARPLTTVKDPMSGFFMLRRETFQSSAPLNPVGYKIALELLVKCRCRNVVEIPIHFSLRRCGSSKLSLKEQLKYIQHLRRLYVFKFGNWAHFAQFSLVGVSGTVVNLATLMLCLELDVPIHAAVAVAIFVSMLSNFVLNRRFTFSYARRESWHKQLVGFIGGSSIGAAVNYATTMGILTAVPGLLDTPQIASICGILAGLVFNYFVSRYYVFRKKK